MADVQRLRFARRGPGPGPEPNRCTVAAAVGIAALAFAFASAAFAVESDPLPVPAGTPRAQAVRTYNDGVALLMQGRHADAQARFEAALALDDQLAEAHNNLAFSLRMQGTHNFDRALAHYNRAIAIKPALAQAYMYRGVLFTQIGDLTRARSDHATLLALDRELAARLQRVIDGAGRDDRSGIAGQYD